MNRYLIHSYTMLRSPGLLESRPYSIQIQVLGPVARCLQLLVSCEQGVNIAQTWQEQEEVAAVDDEDVRRIHKEIALASQEMCGRQAEDCNAILRQRHQKALEYLLKVAHNDQVWAMGPLFSFLIVKAILADDGSRFRLRKFGDLELQTKEIMTQLPDF